LYLFKIFHKQNTFSDKLLFTQAQILYEGGLLHLSQTHHQIHREGPTIS